MVTGDDTLNLCAVSGQRSRGECQRQDLWFCSPEHQRERSRGPDGDRRGVRRPPPSTFCLRESELAVEDEPLPLHRDAAGGGGDDDDAAADAMFEGALFPTVESAAADVDDADLTQSDLNALTGNMALTGVTDPITLAFYHRMNVGGDENDVRGQCLRYVRWPGDGDGKEEREEADDYDDDDDGGGEGDGPLWLSSNDRPPPSWRRDMTSTDDDGGPVDAPCYLSKVPYFVLE